MKWFSLFERLCPFAAPVFLSVGCAPVVPTAFAVERDRAIQAYAHGRYTEAGQGWLRAAGAAERRHDRREAEERAGASFTRAGNEANARKALESVLSDGAPSDQAARVIFQLAELERGSNPNQAEKRYAQVIESFPNAPAAPQALRRLLRDVEAARGPEAALERALALEPRLKDTALGEPLGYFVAGTLQRTGREQPALGRFLALADKYPYPTGAYWDDALWHAAEIRRATGDPKGAIALLDRMLRERETADINGSYERPRYDQAAFAIAEILRDDLRDATAARAAFHRLPGEYPESRLRDDAIWNEALLAHETGNETETCSLLEHLRSIQPDSRYVACSAELCSSAPHAADAKCHPYLLRGLSDTTRSLSKTTP